MAPAPADSAEASTEPTDSVPWELRDTSTDQASSRIEPEVESTVSPGSVQATSNRPRVPWPIYVVPGLIVVLVVGAVLAATLSSHGSSKASDTYVPSPAIATPSIPAGYTDQGNGVATKWLKKGEADYEGGACASYYVSCNELSIYAYEGCPGGGYVEANWENDSGTVFGYSNDILPKLATGQKYVSALGTTGRGQTKIVLTQLTCRPY